MLFRSLARERPAESDDTLGWLTAAVGKDQRALELEFTAYLEQFLPEEPAWLKQQQAFIELREELTTLMNRL